MFTQHIMSCLDALAMGLASEEHPQGDPNCCCIVGEQDGTVAWHSHAPASTPAESRLNPDVPSVKDWR